MPPAICWNSSAFCRSSQNPALTEVIQNGRTCSQTKPEDETESGKYRLGRRSILSRVAERTGHPDKFVEKLVHSTRISRIGNCAGRGIKKFSGVTEINIRKDRDQTKHTQHCQQSLNHARAAEWSRGNAAHAGGIVNVLLQIRVEHILRQTWELDMVLRNDDTKAVGLCNSSGK